MGWPEALFFLEGNSSIDKGRVIFHFAGASHPKSWKSILRQVGCFPKEVNKAGKTQISPFKVEAQLLARKHYKKNL